MGKFMPTATKTGNLTLINDTLVAQYDCDEDNTYRASIFTQNFCNLRRNVRQVVRLKRVRGVYHVSTQWKTRILEYKSFLVVIHPSMCLLTC